MRNKAYASSLLLRDNAIQRRADGAAALPVFLFTMSIIALPLPPTKHLVKNKILALDA